MARTRMQVNYLCIQGGSAQTGRRSWLKHVCRTMIFACSADWRKQGESSGSGLLFECREGLNITCGEAHAQPALNGPVRSAVALEVKANENADYQQQEAAHSDFAHGVEHGLLIGIVLAA